MIRRRVLRLLATVEKPAAWVLLIGGVATFLAVLFDLVRTGDAKWATLLVAADLIVGGFSAVQDAEPQLGDSANTRERAELTAAADG